MYLGVEGVTHLLRGPEHTAGVTQLGVHTPGLGHIGAPGGAQLQVLVGLTGAAAELGVAAVRVWPVQGQVLRTPALGLITLRVVTQLLSRKGEMLETMMVIPPQQTITVHIQHEQ